MTVDGNAASFDSVLGLAYTYRYVVAGTETEGQVNIDIAGTDVSGNSGTGRGSVLLDFTPPAITGVSVTPDPSSEGQTLTIRFDVSEICGFEPAVTVGGRAATLESVTGGGLSYTYGYAVSVPADTEGTADVAIALFDVAGNPASANVQVTFDFTAPALTASSITPDPARASDDLAIAFTASELLAGPPLVTVDGFPATMISTTGLDYAFTYALTGGENEGPVDVVVLGQDPAGNALNATLGVTLDFTAPTVSSLTVAPDPARHADVLVIRFSVDETPASGPAVMVGTRAATPVSVSNGDYEFELTVDRLLDVEGSNPVTVSLSDAAGNPGSGSTTVGLDFTAPTLASFAATPDPAKAGSVLSLAFSVSETLGAAPSVSVGAATATFVSANGNDYIYEYTVTGSEPEGPVVITVTGADPAGNTLSETRSAALDFTAPTFAGINATPDPAKAGDTVSITLTASEALAADPVVTVGSGAAVLANKTGLDYTYTYLVSASDTNGANTISVAASDPAGNAGTGTSSVTLDLVRPTFSTPAASPDPANAGAALTITFSVDEPLAANPAVTVDGNAASFVSEAGFTYVYSYTVAGTETEGSVAVDVTGSDPAGNSGSAQGSLTLDFMRPAFSAIGATPDPAKGGATLTIRFTASEELAANPSVSVDGRAAAYVSNTGADYVYSYAVAGTETEGTATVTVAGGDLAGNPGSDNGSVVLDFTAPAFAGIAATPNPARSGVTLTITFTASEALAANPAVTVAGISAGFVSRAGLSYTYDYTTTGSEPEGAAPITVGGSDLAGNPGSGAGTVTFDFTLPLFSGLTHTPNPAKAADVLTIRFSTSETLSANPAVTVAGNAATFLSLAGALYTYAYSVTGTEPEGSAAIAISGTDLAGNNGSLSGTQQFDFTRPSFSSIVSVPSRATTGANLDITFTASESLAANPTVRVAGNAATYVSNTGLDYRYRYTVLGSEGDGTKPIDVGGLDLVGNSGSDAGSVILDFTAPSFDPISVVPAVARSGQVVEISFTRSEPLAGNPAVTVAGNPATFRSESGGTYVYSYGVLGSEPQGPAPVVVLGTDTVGIAGSDSTTVVLDFAAPLLSNLAFAPAAAQYKINDVITISFDSNEALGPATRVTVDGLPASFDSSVGLRYFFEYTVTGAETQGLNPVVVRGVDLAGNEGTLNGALNIDAAPRVSAVVPADGAIGVSITTTIRAVFSEDMDPTTITSATFLVAGVLGAVTYSAPTRTATFTPSASLATATTFAATVTTGVKDVNGNAMQAPRTWSFTTDLASGAYISGTVSAPASWTDTWVGESTGGYRDNPAANDYQLLVDRRPDNRVYAWDDRVADGLYSPGVEPRLLYHRCAPFEDLIDTTSGSVSGKDVTFGVISGRLTAPGGWTRPRVYEETTLNVATPDANGDYALDVHRNFFFNTLFAFDDADGDSIRDPEEEQFGYGDMVDLCNGFTSPPYNLQARRIGGTVTAIPAGWNARVMLATYGANPLESLAVTTPAGGTGAYSLLAGASAVEIYLFDDANSNNTYDAGERAIRSTVAAVWNGTADVSAVDIRGRRISGTVLTPASWTRARVALSERPFGMPGLTNSMSVPTGGPSPFALDSGSHADNRLFMFDDVDGNGQWEQGESRVDYRSNPIDTSAGDVTGIILNFVTVSGNVSAIPPNWTRPKIVIEQGTSSVVTTVSAGAYSTFAGFNQYSIVRFFDDVDNDGTLDTVTEPSINSAANYVDTRAGGSFTVNVQVCAISGPYDAPPGWSALRAFVQTDGTVYPDGARSNGGVPAASYTVYSSFNTENWLYVFDDRNGNAMMDGYEPRILRSAAVNSVAACPANFQAIRDRRISGTVTPPATWLRPRVRSTRNPYNSAAPDGMGNYAISVDVYNQHYVSLFDDENNNGVYDGGEPNIGYGLNPVNTTGGDVGGVDIVVRTISGRITAPPVWTRPLVLESASGSTAVPDAGGSYLLYTGASANNTVAMFDDVNNNGTYDGFPAEPLIAYETNPVNTTAGDVSGINIGYVTISGRLTGPPEWSQPTAGISGSGFVAAPDGNGDYLLYVGRANYTVSMFDDVNGNGTREFSERLIDYRFNPVDTTGGSVGGVNLDYATIRGRIVPPAAWGNERVALMSVFPNVVALPDAGGNYELHTGFISFNQVTMFDDRDGDGDYDWTEPTIEYRLNPVSTAGGDVSGVDIGFTTISGTITPPGTWTRPHVATTNASLDTTPTGSSYTIECGYRLYTVIMYDDVNGNGAYDWGTEAAYQYCPGGAPQSVDTRLGPQTGIDIGTACVFP